LEGRVFREEWHNGVNRTTAKSIIGEVDFYKVCFIDQSVANCGERYWDFRDESSGEYVSEICDLYV
jgi:hypothetical protein